MFGFIFQGMIHLQIDFIQTLEKKKNVYDILFEQNLALNF